MCTTMTLSYWKVRCEYCISLFVSIVWVTLDRAVFSLSFFLLIVVVRWSRALTLPTRRSEGTKYLYFMFYVYVWRNKRGAACFCQCLVKKFSQAINPYQARTPKFCSCLFAISSFLNVKVHLHSVLFFVLCFSRTHTALPISATSRRSSLSSPRSSEQRGRLVSQISRSRRVFLAAHNSTKKWEVDKIANQRQSGHLHFIHDAYFNIEFFIILSIVLI